MIVQPVLVLHLIMRMAHGEDAEENRVENDQNPVQNGGILHVEEEDEADAEREDDSLQPATLVRQDPSGLSRGSAPDHPRCGPAANYHIARQRASPARSHTQAGDSDRASSAGRLRIEPARAHAAACRISCGERLCSN